jgi:uncharacterized membrane protein YgcG
MDFIIDPLTQEQHNLLSEQGIHILRTYVDMYQSGGRRIPERGSERGSEQVMRPPGTVPGSIWELPGGKIPIRFNKNDTTNNTENKIGAMPPVPQTEVPAPYYEKMTPIGEVLLNKMFEFDESINMALSLLEADIDTIDLNGQDKVQQQQKGGSGAPPPLPVPAELQTKAALAHNIISPEAQKLITIVDKHDTLHDFASHGGRGESNQIPTELILDAKNIPYKKNAEGKSITNISNINLSSPEKYCCIQFLSLFSNATNGDIKFFTFGTNAPYSNKYEAEKAIYEYLRSQFPVHCPIFPTAINESDAWSVADTLTAGQNLRTCISDVNPKQIKFGKGGLTKVGVVYADPATNVPRLKEKEHDLFNLEYDTPHLTGKNTLMELDNNVSWGDVTPGGGGSKTKEFQNLPYQILIAPRYRTPPSKGFGDKMYIFKNEIDWALGENFLNTMQVINLTMPPDENSPHQVASPKSPSGGNSSTSPRNSEWESTTNEVALRMVFYKKATVSQTNEISIDFDNPLSVSEVNTIIYHLYQHMSGNTNLRLPDIWNKLNIRIKKVLFVAVAFYKIDNIGGSGGGGGGGGDTVQGGGSQDDDFGDDDEDEDKKVQLLPPDPSSFHFKGSLWNGTETPMNRFMEFLQILLDVKRCGDSCQSLWVRLMNIIHDDDFEKQQGFMTNDALCGVLGALRKIVCVIFGFTAGAADSPEGILASTGATSGQTGQHTIAVYINKRPDIPGLQAEIERITAIIHKFIPGFPSLSGPPDNPPDEPTLNRNLQIVRKFEFINSLITDFMAKVNTKKMDEAMEELRDRVFKIIRQGSEILLPELREIITEDDVNSIKVALNSIQAQQVQNMILGELLNNIKGVAKQINDNLEDLLKISILQNAEEVKKWLEETKIGHSKYVNEAKSALKTRIEQIKDNFNKEVVQYNKQIVESTVMLKNIQTKKKDEIKAAIDKVTKIVLDNLTGNLKEDEVKRKNDILTDLNTELENITNATTNQVANKIWVESHGRSRRGRRRGAASLRGRIESAINTLEFNIRKKERKRKTSDSREYGGDGDGGGGGGGGGDGGGGGGDTPPKKQTKPDSETAAL